METTLQDYLKRTRDDAAVRRVMLIGGDKDIPEGPFANALTVIESGLLRAGRYRGDRRWRDIRKAIRKFRMRSLRPR